MEKEREREKKREREREKGETSSIHKEYRKGQWESL